MPNKSWRRFSDGPVRTTLYKIRVTRSARWWFAQILRDDSEWKYKSGGEDRDLTHVWNRVRVVISMRTGGCRREVWISIHLNRRWFLFVFWERDLSLYFFWHKTSAPLHHIYSGGKKGTKLAAPLHYPYIFTGKAQTPTAPPKVSVYIHGKWKARKNRRNLSDTGPIGPTI
jgi:hypothetical protein